MGDLATMDPVLARSLSQLQQVVQRKRQLEQDASHTPESRQLAVDSLTLDGAPIEDLGLSFALPGYPEVELKVYFNRLLLVIVDSELSYSILIPKSKTEESFTMVFLEMRFKNLPDFHP